MTHHDEGQYRAKHLDKMPPDTSLIDAVKLKAQDGKISCAQAFALADECSTDATHIGQAIDYLEIKISKCQLGLFGYGKGVKLAKPAETIAPELENALKRETTEKRIACKKLWEIADSLNISRLEAACACEKLGVKITSCQLGAF